jgi:SAM-dependent methyltransferase
MRARVAAGRQFVRAGRFIQSLAVMIMRPRDLLAFNRAAYSTASSVRAWTDEALVDTGLSREEQGLLDSASLGPGPILVLGLGGGREAIALAARGFEVTGVDFVPELVARAAENATRRGYAIRTFVQDLSRLDLPDGAYRAAWLTAGTYSSVPTRRLRLGMLERIVRSLQPGGRFICQFLFSEEREFRPGWEFFRRVVSWLTWGHRSYERGDRLAGGVEFAHYFASAAEVRSEFEAAGFRVVRLDLPEEGPRGGAVLLAPGGKD